MIYTLLNGILLTHGYLLKQVLIPKNYFDDYTRIKRTHLWRMNVNGGYWDIKDVPLDLKECVHTDKVFEVGDWLWYYGTNFLEFQFVLWNVVEVVDYFEVDIPLELVANVHVASMLVTVGFSLVKIVSVGVLGV